MYEINMAPAFNKTIKITSLYRQLSGYTAYLCLSAKATAQAGSLFLYAIKRS